MCAFAWLRMWTSRPSLTSASESLADGYDRFRSQNPSLLPSAPTYTGVKDRLENVNELADLI